METCPHCGEPHGPTECRQALAVRLAEEIDGRIEDQQARASMTLEIADLRRHVVILEMEAKR